MVGRDRLVPANAQVASDVRGGGVPETSPAPPESTNESRRLAMREPREEISSAPPQIQAQAVGFISQVLVFMYLMPFQPFVPSFLPARAVRLCALPNRFHLVKLIT